MKVNPELLREMEKLLDQYIKEVEEAKKSGALTESTARTYLLHTSNFVKWCNGNFVPGGRNQNR